MQFLEKFGKIPPEGLTPPPWGNPGPDAAVVNIVHLMFVEGSRFEVYGCLYLSYMLDIVGNQLVSKVYMKLCKNLSST